MASLTFQNIKNTVVARFGGLLSDWVEVTYICTNIQDTPYYYFMNKKTEVVVCAEVDIDKILTTRVVDSKWKEARVAKQEIKNRNIYEVYVFEPESKRKRELVNVSRR